MKAVIFARVSTEEQKEAGNSLPAQIERLKTYCKVRGFEIVKTFSIDESAYKTKRDDFDTALDFLKTAKEKIVVCFDKVDRFSRNVFDKRVAILYEMAMQDKIELHFTSDNLIITPNISATEKFHFGMNLGLAKYYSDAISDSVKRANETKIRNGEWAGMAPIGYINQDLPDGKKTVVPDPDRTHSIVRMFELYSTGQHSIKSIKQEMDKIGFTTRTGKKLTTSLIHRTLKNPFYYGVMKIKSKEYPHRYEPIIPQWLFDKCQAVTASYHKKPFKALAKPFIFRGLIRCDKCGCLITPEIKKGKYIYYSCTNYKGMCDRVWVPEKELLKPIYDTLKALQLPKDTLDSLTEELKKIGRNELKYHQTNITALKTEYDLIENRISKMYEDKLDGSITHEMYDKKFKAYKEKQAEIFENMNAHSKADEEFYLTADKVFSLAKRALEIFESSKVPEKRQLLSFLLKNCKLKGENLLYELNSPFDLLVQASNNPMWLRD